MKRLSLLLVVALAAGTAAQQPPPAQRTVSAFFDAFTAEWIRGDPNQAVSTRYFSGAEQDALDQQLSPETPEFRHARAELARRGLQQLAAFDRARMSESERASADLMKWQLEQIVEGDKYQDYFFPFQQFSGVNVRLPEVLTVSHPLNSEKDAVHYVARLGQVAARMDEAIANARRLAGLRMIPPRFILRATIAQMQQFVALPPARNPLVATFDQRLAAAHAVSDARREALRLEAERIVASQVYPAWRRALAVLRPLVARATDDAGLWRFKGGAEAYAYTLRRYTTTTLTADQIHQIGLERVAELERQMDDVLRRMGRTEGSVRQRIAQLAKEQAYPLTDEGRARIMADANAIIRDAEARARLQFDRTPRAGLEARPFPRFSEANGAANYTAPAPDGSRPGIVQIPLRPERMTKFGLKTLLYHEGVPGHHFQIALELENRAAPRFRRIRAFGVISALNEGWGLYAEHLAAESGWYEDDPVGLLGELDSELFRARRLVVDTGIHAKRWTRQQAIDYGIEPSEVERYVVNPGQACAYMIGELKLLELREKARKALGSGFNIREFHDAVLGAGTLPLDQLEAAVDAYIKKAAIVASLPKGEQVVPVYHEPHHRMLFAYGTTKILEGQIPPGDTSWFHVHAEPILYLTLSASTQRTQVLGQEWSGGGGRGAPNAAGRGGTAGRGAAPTGPAVRPTSTTSYYDEPVTHRIQNVGDRLFRFMVVTNASAGDESAATPADRGFTGTPELANRWFRAYRITLAPGGSTPLHRHATESVIIQVSNGEARAIGPMTWELGEQGRWAWFDKGAGHELRNVGRVPFEAIEIEVRQPEAP